MTDVVDKSTRSRMMAGIKGKNTVPELRVRSALHAAGYRFRLHRRDLPGRPDLVLPQFRVAVFIHGCFWHRHRGCLAATLPASNPEFWLQKLEGNVVRDERNILALRDMGWRVATIWECATRRTDPNQIAREFTAWLQGKEETLEIPHLAPPVSVTAART